MTSGLKDEIRGRESITSQVSAYRPIENRIMAPENQEKVLERLATTEKTTIVIGASVGGKIRVSSRPWDAEKVFLRAQVLGPATVPAPSRRARTPPACASTGVL
jgi:hypothetical protein